MPAPPTDAEGRVSLWLTAQSIIAFWSFYFITNTLRSWLIDSPAQFDMIGRRAVVTMFGIGLSGFLYLLLRRLEYRGTRVLLSAVFIAAIPLALAYSAFNRLVFYVIYPHPALVAMMAEAPDKFSPFLQILGQAVEWYAFIVAWGVLWIALAYAAQVRGAERVAARYRAAAQAAELRALRYQVNPHFLFNTLNSLSALVLAGRNDDAERMILNLATFFRTTLSSDPAGDVPLADEIAMQRLYLDIEKVRFPERLQTRFDVPDELHDAAVPGLILQPLIENAVKHGVARSHRPVTITVSARAAANRLELLVEDDGEGDPRRGARAPLGAGVGVRNVCERLMARFGPAARCSSGQRSGGGFRVLLSMPLSRV
jgi:two-component system LytT family sensor kinase